MSEKIIPVATADAEFVRLFGIRTRRNLLIKDLVTKNIERLRIQREQVRKDFELEKKRLEMITKLCDMDEKQFSSYTALDEMRSRTLFIEFMNTNSKMSEEDEKRISQLSTELKELSEEATQLDEFINEYVKGNRKYEALEFTFSKVKDKIPKQKVELKTIDETD
jgi:hypothetical protein